MAHWRPAWRNWNDLSAPYQRSCQLVPFGDFPETGAWELPLSRTKPLIFQGLAPGTFPPRARFGKVPSRRWKAVPSTAVLISHWAALRGHPMTRASAHFYDDLV